MYHPTSFCVKLQVHFGGDVHEISVPAYGGAEPTVADLMNAVEHNFRVPRELQNLVFQGQELHSRSNEPLSHFGIRNGVPIRLVGRMVSPDKINPINTHSYQQPYYTEQSNTVATFHTNEQSLPYYHEQFRSVENASVGTQYDPPLPSPDKNQSSSMPDQGQISQHSNDDEHKPPTTPNSSDKK
ncbi:unnamed protein product [Rotaria sp. Silwood2]|nr:unnamed protein product [Rotaria sp. Silwood2]CAF2583608.1 unnamed protein product [Rotaria sp. Silwood2]CAF2991426.1 unnamed protein product [Rotaria sp. Silwood2]CAF3867194.1 unnamed protein product [Rotaria sp. Silwood2]CAF3971203.1 unnamed protein product [Rotaria sp. Silwood2]